MNANQQPRQTDAILAQLCQRWMDAKHAEDRAKAEKDESARLIAAMLSFSKEEGAQTFSEVGYKITLTGVINRKMNWEKYRGIESQIPENLRPVKPALDETGIKYLRNNEPEIYSLIANCLTATPGKTSCKVEAL